MIRTKLAKKVLNKTEQRHLTEMGIYSMKTFRRTRYFQIKLRKDNRDLEPCFDCKQIAHKLGIE